MSVRHHRRRVVAHFLRMGFDVAAWDPAAAGEARVRTLVENVWPTLEKFGLTAGASPDRLTYGASLEQALEGAEFVQESASENVAIKVHLLARIDAAAAADVVIASSGGLSSGCRWRGGRRRPPQSRPPLDP